MNHYYTYIPGYPVFPYVYNTPYYNSYNYTTSSYPYFENRKFYEERQNIVPIIVWHNSDTNMTLIWFMDGHRIKRRETVLDENGRPIFVGPPWRIVGANDMDNDNQPDIIWHNSDTNMTLIWFMDGHRIKRRETVLDENGRPIFAGPPWNIVGVSDINGGSSDIIWHNSDTNMTLIWFMDGHRIKRRETVLDENERPIFAGLPWNIVGTSNWVNFDQPIITWHNSDTNMTLYWIMNNHKIRRRETVLDENGRPIFVGPPWNIVGAGHMQVIGLGPDIIWHNSDTNMILIWFMNQHKIRSRETVLDENGRPIFVGPPWNIVGAGHMQVIGLGPDIIWHNSDTNMILIWFMNQHKIRSRETVLDENGRPIFVGSPWNIVAVTFKIVPIFNPGPRNNKWKHDQIHEINEK